MDAASAERTLATDIVDALLALVEKAGEFHGRGKKRVLMLNDLATIDGQLENARTRMIVFVEANLGRRHGDSCGFALYGPPAVCTCGVECSASPAGGAPVGEQG